MINNKPRTELTMNQNYIKQILQILLGVFVIVLSSCSSSLDIDPAFAAVKSTVSVDKMSITKRIYTGQIRHNTPERAAYYQKHFSFNGVNGGDRGAINAENYAQHLIYQDNGLLTIKQLSTVPDPYKDTHMVEITVTPKGQESVIGKNMLSGISGNPKGLFDVKYYTYNLSKPIEIRKIGEDDEGVDTYILIYETLIDSSSPFAEADGIKVGDMYPITEEPTVNYALIYYDSKNKEISVNRKDVIKESEIEALYEKYTF